MRFTCNSTGEDYLVVISIVCLPTYILYVARGIILLTKFQFVTHKVFGNDLIVFLAIYMVFLVGFSQGKY
jgi:hypothetical protein